MLDLLALIQMCTPRIAPSTMQAIIKVESKGNPNAIGLNKGYRLQYPAKDINQAKRWVEYLEKNNYNFDVGLAQVNIKNIHRFGYKATDALDPCLNLKMAGKILTDNYKSAKSTTNSPDAALSRAISAYNTGNFNSGFNNGYVQKVYLAANNQPPAYNNIPPIIDTKYVNKKQKLVKKQNKETIKYSDEENPYTSKVVLSTPNY